MSWLWMPSIISTDQTANFSLPFDQDGNNNAKNMVKIIILISYNENIWGLF